MSPSGRRISAADLGIDLADPGDQELFRWLVACSLFAARISQDIAARAFRELDAAGLLTPAKLANADWQRLVDLLGAGGYRRYDESTARELMSLGQLALHRYGGRLTRLRTDNPSRRKLSERLQEFKGIGPTGARIFLRELSPAGGR